MTVDCETTFFIRIRSVLCDIRIVLYDMGVCYMIWLRYDNIPMKCGHHMRNTIESWIFFSATHRLSVVKSRRN